jgi:hypothetical protein
VIGIVDMCHAAGAVPEDNRLAAGIGGGRNNLGLLLAATVHHRAFGFTMSCELTDLLQKGLATEGETLSVAAVGAALDSRIPTQVIAYQEFAGYPARLPWVAYNRSHVFSVPVSRSIAALELSEALAGLSEFADVDVNDACHNAVARRKLEARLRAHPGPGLVRRAVEVLEAAKLAQHTSDFLVGHLPDALSAARLRAAILDPEITPPSLQDEVHRKLTGRNDADFTDYVEYLALLRYTSDREGDRAGLVRFVCALAVDAGTDINAELLDWVRPFRSHTTIIDILQDLRAKSADRRAQLILALDESLSGEWTGTARAWLRRDGKTWRQEQFTAEPVNQQQDAEKILRTAVSWAEGIIEQDGPAELRLHRVDIAMPSRLMLCWRPEEVHMGPPLGYSRDVFMHWNVRLNPPAHLSWIREHAKFRWEAIARLRPPVNWLDNGVTRDLKVLERDLGRGTFPAAIALAGCPAENVDLLSLLLAYSPVVLWPATPPGFPVHRRQHLITTWPVLPGALLDAYRTAWTGPAVDPLADLRTVWEDMDWLDFVKKLNLDS